MPPANLRRQLIVIDKEICDDMNRQSKQPNLAI